MDAGVGRPGVARRRPTGRAARLLRLPLVLYRLRLGWLLGHRFAEITHRGRRSGRVYRSVVEVVRFDPATREVVVMTAWRGQTDWYRNIRAQPALEVRTGRLRFVPEQRLLGPDESVRELQGYVGRNPVVARVLAWLFGVSVGAPAGVADFFRAVSFRPQGTSRIDGLEPARVSSELVP
jgi:deazaflavin-dependent oxidoreductase (nitroreductase family)